MAGKMPRQAMTESVPLADPGSLVVPAGVAVARGGRGRSASGGDAPVIARELDGGRPAAGQQRGAGGDHGRLGAE
jgi:hypothetical protein